MEQAMFFPKRVYPQNSVVIACSGKISDWLVILVAALYSARQLIGRFLADTDKTVTT